MATCGGLQDITQGDGDQELSDGEGPTPRGSLPSYAPTETSCLTGDLDLEDIGDADVTV